MNDVYLQEKKLKSQDRNGSGNMNRKVWVLSAKYLHRGDLEEWFNPKPLTFISWCIRCRNSLSEVMFKKDIYSNLSQVTPTTILQSFFITVVYQRFPKSLRETVFSTRKTWVQGFVSHLKVTKICLRREYNSLFLLFQSNFSFSGIHRYK